MGKVGQRSGNKDRDVITRQETKLYSELEANKRDNSEKVCQN